MTNTLAPDVLAKQLNPYFIGRNDLINRWGNVISSYLALPGLRFFAPMSVIGASGQARDLALGNDLTNNNSSSFSFDYIPYCSYNGTNQYHSITDNSAHDILGTEAYIASAKKGLTIGMWVNPRDIGSASRLFSKGATTGNARAYALTKNADATDKFNLIVSSNGTDFFAVTDTSNYTQNQWHFLAGRYLPSSELKIYVGDATNGYRTNINNGSIAVSLNNSATGLAIAAQADGTAFSNIYASMCFICVEALADHHMNDLYQQTKRLYGV